MPFRLSLYRAPEGLGPLHTWESEHREPLGTRDALQAAITQAFPQIRWRESGGLLFGAVESESPEGGAEVSLFGAPDEVLWDVGIYAGPPMVRHLMTHLRLNHCYAPESAALYFPFKVGDRWDANA